MIVDKHKHPLPDDPTTNDAPPSYDDINRLLLPEKSPLDDSESPAPASPALKSPTGQPSEFVKKDKGKSRIGASSWFNSSAARTSREIRTTVLGLLRDLVQEHPSNSPAAIGILKSCADACATHNVALSEILQQKFIEDHTPLYWSIVKRLPDDHPDVDENQGPDLLTALISYASPLSEEAMREIRLACLATSDQKLFHRLKQTPEFGQMSAVDQMLLGVKIPTDEIEVEDISPDGGAFVAAFVIPQFHKRMVVSKKITLEFIARGRMWNFSFLVAPPPKFQYADPPEGSWCVSLSLQGGSPPTHIDSRLVIPETSLESESPRKESQTIPVSPSVISPTGHSPSPLNIPGTLLSSKQRPAIAIRLRTSSKLLEAPGKNSCGNRIVVPLEKSLIGAKLQYSNNPYIASDEKLRARFEARLGKARLGKSDAECIIC